MACCVWSERYARTHPGTGHERGSSRPTYLDGPGRTLDTCVLSLDDPCLGVGQDKDVPSPLETPGAAPVPSVDRRHRPAPREGGRTSTPRTLILSRHLLTSSIHTPTPQEVDPHTPCVPGRIAKPSHGHTSPLTLLVHRPPPPTPPTPRPDREPLPGHPRKRVQRNTDHHTVGENVYSFDSWFPDILVGHDMSTIPVSSLSHGGQTEVPVTTNIPRV